MQKLSDALHSRILELLLLLSLYPITWLGGLCGAWLLRVLPIVVTTEEVSKLAGGLAGLQILTFGYLLVVLWRHHYQQNRYWNGIELKRGFGRRWHACCPNCHVPLPDAGAAQMTAYCPSNCGCSSSSSRLSFVGCG